MWCFFLTNKTFLGFLQFFTVGLKYKHLKHLDLSIRTFLLTKVSETEEYSLLGWFCFQNVQDI